MKIPFACVLVSFCVSAARAQPAVEPAGVGAAVPVLSKSHPTVLLHLVPIQKTDPDLRVDPREHYAYLDTRSPRRNQLFLFLPGTYATGASCPELNAVAAETGYHVLSLTYRSRSTVRSRGRPVIAWTVPSAGYGEIHSSIPRF